MTNLESYNMSYVIFSGSTIVYWLFVNKRNRNMKSNPVFTELKA